MSGHTVAAYRHDLLRLRTFLRGATGSRAGTRSITPRCAPSRRPNTQAASDRAASNGVFPRSAPFTSSCCARDIAGAIPPGTCARPRPRSGCRPLWMRIRWRACSSSGSAIPCRRATRPSWNCSTPPGCGWANWSASTSAPSISPIAPCGWSARAARRASCRSAGMRSTRCKNGSSNAPPLPRPPSGRRELRSPSAPPGGASVKRGMRYSSGVPDGGSASGRCSCASACGRAARVSECTCTRICCATRSRLICSNRAAICAEFRNCWGTPTSARPRSTRIWTFSTWRRSMTPRIRVRGVSAA